MSILVVSWSPRSEVQTFASKLRKYGVLPIIDAPNYRNRSAENLSKLERKSFYVSLVAISRASGLNRNKRIHNWTLNWIYSFKSQTFGKEGLQAEPAVVPLKHNQRGRKRPALEFAWKAISSMLKSNVVIKQLSRKPTPVTTLGVGWVNRHY